MPPDPDPLEGARERLVVALDLDTPQEALAAGRDLAGTVSRVKVGSRLFLAGGPDVVLRLVDLGLRVFLDLKFHDIPDQVAGACARAASLGVDLLTVHASGGGAMLRAASAAVGEAGAARPRVLAVTVLTSLAEADLGVLGISRSLGAQVTGLAELARASGVDGVVCSPRELAALRPALPSPFLLVTPGIRGAGEEAQDQARALPAPEAVRRGADLLVVGRPVLRAPSRADAARALLQQIAESLG